MAHGDDTPWHVGGDAKCIPLRLDFKAVLSLLNGEIAQARKVCRSGTAAL
ncbi:hypothetical protein MesoLj131c_67520 (plasmid) [Mesorhizobium sp. 131-3-5]|nr:hypothetical protein MesoLj131c_67520 [Mesorhizobium sp. 131-3-5]